MELKTSFNFEESSELNGQAPAYHINMRDETRCIWGEVGRGFMAFLIALGLSSA